MPPRSCSASAARRPGHRHKAQHGNRIPTFTLNNLTAGPGGTATSTTVLTEPPSANGPAQLAIPSSGWFINVAAGPAADNGTTSAACGNVVYHNAAVMRYLPQNLRIHVGETVVWANNTSNELHAVTFLAGQPLAAAPVPDHPFH